MGCDTAAEGEVNATTSLTFSLVLEQLQAAPIYCLETALASATRAEERRPAKFNYYPRCWCSVTLIPLSNVDTED